jgi:hypothetical protein
LTCETQGDIRHCFDHHGYLSAEERSAGGYVDGWDTDGHAWTEAGRPHVSVAYALTVVTNYQTFGRANKPRPAGRSLIGH